MDKNATLKALRAGDWAHARLFDSDHRNVHACRALYHANLRVRMSCETDEIRECPIQTCEELLKNGFGKPGVDHHDGH